MYRVLEILNLYLLSMLINNVYPAGSTQIVTGQQHKRAVLPFQFPFISGLEDLDVTMMKMQSIRDTKPSVIYSIHKGTEEYYAAQYRHRTVIRTDLFRGQLDLILNDMKKSDEGFYKCQATNPKDHGEMMIQLYIEPSKPEVLYNVTNGTITVYCETNSMGVTYEWRNSSGNLLSTEAVYTASPETLRIGDTITCIVRNKVSESSSSVTIEDYTPKGSVTIPYLPEENTESNGKREILIRVSLLSVVFLLSLPVILILYLGCKRLRVRFRLTSQKYLKKSQSSACEVKPLNSVNPDKAATTCDTDSIFEIKDIVENDPLQTGRERHNKVNNEVFIVMEKQGEPMRAQHHQNQMENASFQEIPDSGERALTLDKSHEKTSECEEKKPGNTQGAHAVYS